MPETRPPIELQGLSLADLQRLIDERRLPPVDQWNPKRCGHSGHAHRARRHLVSPGLRYPPAGDGAPVLDRAEARAGRAAHARHSRREARDRRRGNRLPRGRDGERGRRARAPDCVQARQRRRGDSRAGPSAADRPSSSADPASATGSRPNLRALSITSLPRSLLPRAASHPACGATAQFFPLSSRE